MSYEKERAVLEQLSRKIYDRGLVIASDGNFSMRLPGGNILITPSKRNKGMLTAEDFLVVSFDGKAMEGGTPSAEFTMHRFIYQKRPDAMVILHSHPLFATAFSSSKRAVPQDYFVEAPLFLGEVPVTRFAVPGTQDMVDAIAPYVDQTKNLLLKNHGALVWDGTAEAAYNRLEVLEAVCRMTLYTEALGGAQTIAPEDMERVKKSKQKKGKL